VDEKFSSKKANGSYSEILNKNERLRKEDMLIQNKGSRNIKFLTVKHGARPIMLFGFVFTSDKFAIMLFNREYRFWYGIN
jgi:hypothetical protein